MKRTHKIKGNLLRPPDIHLPLRIITEEPQCEQQKSAAPG